jgi:putrescine---pyruvate transaminase
MAQTAFLHPFAKPTGTDFITIVKGEGSVVWDNTGKSYIDAMASLWYNAVGHGRQEITAAVTEQMNKIAVFNCFDPFTNEPTEALAERIRGLAPVDDARVFFAGSGSEAIDSAMKLARIAHVQAGQPERDIIISRGRGYHGVNYGGTSAQGLPLNQQGFGPLLPGIINVRPWPTLFSPTPVGSPPSSPNRCRAPAACGRRTRATCKRCASCAISTERFSLRMK